MHYWLPLCLYVGKEAEQHSKSGATAATPSNNGKVRVHAWKGNCTLFKLYIFIIIHRVMQLPRNCRLVIHNML